MIDYMELKKVPPGSYVIREGDSGERDCTDTVIIGLSIGTNSYSN